MGILYKLVVILLKAKLTKAMNHLNKVLIVVLTLLLFSCGKESYKEEEASDGLNLKANSSIASLMKRTVMNDGSNDNIIDRANCFNVQLPITVTANGQKITIASDDDFSTIETIFDTSNSDQDILDILFPITITRSDFSEVTVNSQIDLTTLANTCNGEGIGDDDIECIDFVYPITASMFNKTTELTSKATFNTDKQLFAFIEGLDENIVVNIDFPITVMLSDQSTAPIVDLSALEATIENSKDDCDEDDDFDYNDDEEDDPSDEERSLITLITSCVWETSEIEIDDQNLLNTFSPYSFSFTIDGTVMAVENGNNNTGNWSIITVDGGLVLIIAIESLPELNNLWRVDEINMEDDGTRLKLKQGEDEIEFKQNCN